MVLKRFLLSVPALLLLGMILVPDDLLRFQVKTHYSGQVDRLFISCFLLSHRRFFTGSFFHRYRKLFPGKGLLLFASTVVFSFVHIIYLNLVAVALTLAGVISSQNLPGTDSSAYSHEHSIYGCFLCSGAGSGFFIIDNQLRVNCTSVYLRELF